MPRTLIPTRFKLIPSAPTGASLQLQNPERHTFSVHPISPSIVRVVHELPNRFKQKTNGGIDWEAPCSDVKILANEEGTIRVETSKIVINVATDGCPRLQWFAKASDGTVDLAPFHSDSPSRAYAYDAQTGGVLHYTDRENHLPVSEDEFSTPDFIHEERNEFIYGLGETNGPLEKSQGRKFTLEGRDALSYGWEHGDPLYKVHPFYTVYNKSSKRWHGVFYCSLVDATIDLGAESDILFGCFRTYRANSGPLDYYILTGDGTLPSVLSEYASLVSPLTTPFTASPTLPPLSQFGYLSSSLSLAADPKAQEAIINFLRTSRREGFPVDGLYLSSGWCQDEITDDRNYFAWNRVRYPTPAVFGHTVETELEVRVIVNMKPWLLEAHPFIESAEASSKAGSKWWGDAIKEYVMANGLTGMWIDNNEMAGMVDDDELLRGEMGMWNAVGTANNVERRMGWRGGKTTVGAVGKALQTIGMARATYEAVISADPTTRPVIVSRSGVPGIQAFAHATWSGDNSTTWKALNRGTAMTLSVGMSFGPGLYGHDIGGKHHPSPELLVRWCQNGAWHSRFTVHSWKEISTTLWMYNDVPGISQILRDVLAWRYRLAPTFYSLYVTHYHQKGWPLLKPLLWHHSDDPRTLKLDEEFIFGTHALVAPVTVKGAITRDLYLPAIANDGERGLQWCELDTGKWHQGEGAIKTFDVPLARTLVLVRGGGILVLGGACTKNIYDGVNERTALIFPTSNSQPGSTGHFTLVEDDGRTNSTARTQLELSFAVVDVKGVEVVQVDYQLACAEFELPFDTIWWELPSGDGRNLVGAAGKEVHRDSEGRFGLKL
ncbi:hypothetical protein RQP46_004365 [Phenoliferia psychrophenolica]